jgi:hypothetical protein
MRRRALEGIGRVGAVFGRRPYVVFWAHSDLRAQLSEMWVQEQRTNGQRAIERRR